MTNAVGRPTVYRTEMCDEIIEMRTRGEIMEGVAHKWKVTLETINEWRKDHPEFSEAFTRAKIAYAQWFHAQIIEHMNTSKEIKVNERLYGLIAGWQLNRSDKPTENPVEVGDFDDSLEGQRKAAKKALKDKKITMKGYSDWMSAIASEAVIIEKTEQEKRLQEIEKKINK